MKNKMRNVRAMLSALLAGAALIVVSCSKTPASNPGSEEEKRPVPKFTVGRLDSLKFTAYKPLASKPVTVYYYIPDNDAFDIRTMPVLFSMHGAERNGLGQAKNWISVADDKGIIVIAPQFTKSLYPNKDYQLGGISYDTANYVPKMTEQWTYQIIEALFDYVREGTGNRSETYSMFGHSAGGQWTHRFLLNMKQHRCGKAVEANAGYYTVPDPKGISDGKRTYYFPFSIKGMFYEEADMKYPLDKYDYMTTDQLKKYLAFDLTVHLGALDTVTSAEVDPNLPVSDGAEAQGRCRLERGHFFFDRAKRVADSLGCPFNWKLVEVAESGHSSAKMINGKGKTGAAYILFSQQ